MTYDRQLFELRVINVICKHNGISHNVIARIMRLHHMVVLNWVTTHGGQWGIYEDDNAQLYLTWHHGGMEWRLPGGVMVDGEPVVVV